MTKAKGRRGRTRDKADQPTKENVPTACCSDAGSSNAVQAQAYFIGVPYSERSSPRLHCWSATALGGKRPMKAVVFAQRTFASRPVEDVDGAEKFWDEYLGCEQCERFYDVMCAKHPLLFVKQPKALRPRMDNRAELSVLPFLQIGESTVAGKGVFTRIDLPAGIVFGPYQGIRVRCGRQAAKHGYAWRVDLPPANGRPRCCFVDAFDPDASCWMRFVNCANDESEQNVVSFQYKRNIYYKVFKPVQAGAELLVWYGQSYGADLGIKVVPAGGRRPNAKRKPYSNPFIMG